jgi:hypothetical protein
MSIRYTVQTGSLPTGLTLNPETGKFDGSPTWTALGKGPTFTTPVSDNLGTFNPGDSVSVGPLEATVESGLSLSSMGIVNGGTGLPWGIEFNPVTRMLTGVPIQPTIGQARQQDNVNGPTWNTQFGKIGDFEEGTVANLSVSASPFSSRTVDRYAVVSGGLPWGLTLSKTGSITGTVADLKSPGLTIETPKLPAPTWTTTAGTIAIANEFESVSVQIAATTVSPRTMVKYCIRSGGLPWGLSLNTVNGTISGTVAELQLRGDLDYYIESGKDPQIGGTVKINTVDTSVAAMGSLGTFAKGSTNTIEFTLTPYAGRSILRSYVSLGTLPWGLEFNSIGKITGTIHTTRAVSGTYTITVSVLDSAGATYSRTYTLTVQ